MQAINRETLQLISEEVLWFLRSLVFTFLKSIQQQVAFGSKSGGVSIQIGISSTN